jgi:hypothetical protein
MAYPMPFHVDEWHHISESIRMENYGEYFEMLRGNSITKFTGLEVGFHFFLFMISWVVNLVWTYQYLPALWAVFSALALFYVVYKKTNNNFLIAWLAMIFFASIRSNVNLTGLWFFTPLTFSIPFIFLYIYFLTNGIEDRNRKHVLIGLVIIIFLIITHSISFLFSIPALLIHSIINYKRLIRDYKFFLLFLIIPILGVVFYKYTLAVPWQNLLIHLFNSLQFRYGWGVLEIHNSLTEIYHWIGYALALIGVFFIINSKNSKKYAFYLLWPATTFAFVVIYKLTGISYLSPYQRNLYYFALSLPFLSAIGLYSLIKLLQKQINRLFAGDKKTVLIQKFATVTVNINISEEHAKLIKAIITIIIVSIISLLVLLLAFTNYYNLPPQVSLYHVIEKKHYDALEFISSFPKASVMATPFVSTALYPITGHNPIGTVAFYGDKRAVEAFFLNQECSAKEIIIKSFDIKYVISPIYIDCDYEEIYHQKDNYIYKINRNNDK